MLVSVMRHSRCNDLLQFALLLFLSTKIQTQCDGIRIPFDMRDTFAQAAPWRFE
jgi:hypothetical protein